MIGSPPSPVLPSVRSASIVHLYCQLYEDNIHGEEVAAFFRQLLKHVSGHLIVLLDNSKIHRGDPVHELLTHLRQLFKFKKIVIQ